LGSNRQEPIERSAGADQVVIKSFEQAKQAEG